MKMKYVVFIACFLGTLVAEGREDITVKVKDSAITITVLGRYDIQNLFFSMDIGKNCTADYTFFHSQDKNGTFIFTIDVKKQILRDDSLRIFGVFETENEITMETYDLIIDSYGNGIEKETCGCLSSYNTVLSKLKEDADVLIFKEDFDQTLSNWTHEKRSRIYDKENDREFVAFINHTNTNYIKDGYLHIIAKWANYTDNLPFIVDGCTTIKDNPNHIKDCGPQYPQRYMLPPVHSAKLHTRGKFQFKYGRVEIRARMPIGDWLFPYLILQPTTYFVEENYVNQLRIAYTRSNSLLQNKNSVPISGSRLFGSAVVWTSDKFLEYVNFKIYPQHKQLSNDFHNYTLIWHKDRIIYKVDNVTYGTITNSTVLKEFNSKECYIVLGLSAAGNVNFPDETVMSKHKPFLNTEPRGPYKFENLTNKKTWTQPNLLIDYVYVYTTHRNEE